MAVAQVRWRTDVVVGGCIWETHQQSARSSTRNVCTREGSGKVRASRVVTHTMHRVVSVQMLLSERSAMA